MSESTASATTEPDAPLAPTVDASAIPTRVLVLGMAHEDGSIVGAELYDVAGAIGQSMEQVRSCVRRLIADGLFERDGEGRDAVFRATDAGRAALGAYIERTRLAYVQDAQGRGWDRRWRLVAFAVPESQRAARNQLRDRLRLLGGASLQSGLYVSPNDWLPLVLPEAERLGIGCHVVAGTTDDLVVGGETDPKRIAAALWPIESLRARYQAFLEAYGDLPQSLRAMRERRQRLPEPAFLAGALSMVVAFRECFDLDPLLPPELLPRPWPGKAARELVAESHRLALLSREEHRQPALFRFYADIARSAG